MNWRGRAPWLFVYQVFLPATDTLITGMAWATFDWVTINKPWWYETFISILPLSFSLPKHIMEEETLLRHLITLPIVSAQADRRVGSLKILLWKDFFILTKDSAIILDYGVLNFEQIYYNRKEWSLRGKSRIIISLLNINNRPQKIEKE